LKVLLFVYLLFRLQNSAWVCKAGRGVSTR
jgi:hypothetical protein